MNNDSNIRVKLVNIKLLSVVLISVVETDSQVVDIGDRVGNEDKGNVNFEFVVDVDE